MENLRGDLDFTILNTSSFVIVHRAQRNWQAEEIRLDTGKSTLGLEDKVLHHAAQLRRQ